MRIPYISSALSELKPNAEWAIRGNTYSDIEWLDKSQTKPTEEEVNKKIADLQAEEPFRLLRIERNKLIAETDWTQLKDIDLDIIRERDWKNYRQALRDLPSKSTPKLDVNGELDMTSVTWPDKPSS
tara:strand:- start:23 stop:403 length:381 start_codon:yes stop_codon:yes gene_type:complete